MRAAAIVLLFLLAAMRLRVPLWLGGPVSVPVPVAAAVIMCLALGALVFLILSTGARDGWRIVPCAGWSVTP